MPRLLCTTMILVCLAAVAVAGNPVPFTARDGMDVATDAARTWASDARLIYLENDETVAGGGAATRWGYLFHSESRGESRCYTVRDGKILEASDLGFDFDAPPLPDEWIDSARALDAAEKKAGSKYRVEHGGRLSTMLLIRGAFNEKKPNASTWALLYTSDTVPALVVIVDAASGDIVRTWRG